VKLTNEEVLVLLGRYNLKATAEVGAVQRAVSEIITHPDWKIYTKRYDADIAILVLASKVQYSNYIRAACLPSEDHLIFLGNGTIVGWGKTENSNPFDARDIEDVPQSAEIEAIDGESCYIKDPDIARLSSMRSFCAGGQSSGPCR